MLLFIENHDSFSYIIKDYCHRLGQAVTVVLNDTPPEKLPDLTQFDGVILSPGPGTPTQSGYLMQMLPVLAARLPVLGICLGHQALALHFDGRVGEAIAPVHGKTSALDIRKPEHPMFANMQYEGAEDNGPRTEDGMEDASQPATQAEKPKNEKDPSSVLRPPSSDPSFSIFHFPFSIDVVRYHSLIVTQLPPGFEALAYSQEGELMAMAHTTLPIWGVQFHPEAELTRHGIVFLANWLRFACNVAAIAPTLTTPSRPPLLGRPIFVPAFT